MTNSIDDLRHQGADFSLRQRFSSILLAILAVLSIGLGLLSPTAAMADASSTPTIAITQTTPATQQSGLAFVYNIEFGCSNVNAGECAADPVVTVPLGAAEGFAVNVGSSSFIESWEVGGGDLVIRLTDLVQGSSGSIGISITPPNRTTPNGTSWSLEPTISFSDETPSVTAAPVTSTATAQPMLSVYKTVDAAYHTNGDKVVFTLMASCAASGNSTGVEDQTQIVLTDTLPAGLTYVSSTPAGAQVSGQVVTFTLSAAQLGDSCAKGTGSSVPVTITASVDEGVADATQLTNIVQGQSTSLSGIKKTSSSSARITVVSGVAGPALAKRGFGPLLNNVGDVPISEATADKDRFKSATFPGRWLNGGFDSLPSYNLFLGPWSSTFTTQIEGMYALRVEQKRSGSEFSLLDPMPCNTNSSGQAYVSNSPSGPVCDSPAFHPTLVTIDASASTTSQRVGIPSELVVQARLTDGTILDLTVMAAGIAAPQPPQDPVKRTYVVPDALVGNVAEILIPRVAGMTNNVTDVFIGGYVDEDRTGGDLIRNIGQVSSFHSGDDDAFSIDPTNIATIYVKEGPQIGIAKNYVPSDSGFQIDIPLILRDEAIGDLTFTDLLPQGWTVTGTPVANVFSLANSSWSNNVSVTAVTATDPATGRTKLRVTVPKETINSQLQADKGAILQLQLKIPSASAYPGTYSNTGSVSIADSTVQENCLTGSPIAATAENPFACESTTSFVIQPGPGSNAVQVVKSVKGSLDSEFKTYPAVGRVEGSGGTAAFRLSWTNKSATPLKDVVAYDLLPMVGDSGTLPTTESQVRGSTFRPALVGLGTLPAGITAYYSTASNPCRPEVLPTNPGCDATWAAMPVNPTDLADVTALKFVSTGIYEFDQGFAVEVNMTTPAGLTETDVAWNTFATSQNLVSGGSLPAVEAAKVGIAHKDFGEPPVENGQLQWNKVDADGGASLSGSAWTLQALDGDGDPSGALLQIDDCTEAPCTGLDQDPAGGTFRIADLVPGTYQLVEARSPSGYILDSSPRLVTVVAGELVTQIDDIENTRRQGPSLPFTGGLFGRNEFAVIGLLVVALGAGAAIALNARRKKRGAI